MRKISVPVPEEKKIEINGNVFTLYGDDIDILSRALAFEEKYTDFKSGDTREILAAIREIIAFINDVLGDTAAMKKIAKNRSVSLNYAVTAMRKIVDEVTKEYQDRVEADYE